MEIVNRSKVVLTMEDLQKMVVEYLAKNANVQGKIVSITHNLVQEEIPGIDPHDCDYRDVFTGITVVIEN